MKTLRAVLHHPTTNLVVALMLISTSLIEVWESATGATVQMALGGMEMKVGAYDGLLAQSQIPSTRARPPAPTVG